MKGDVQLKDRIQGVMKFVVPEQTGGVAIRRSVILPAVAN
jgi:hypothetical protein